MTAKRTTSNGDIRDLIDTLRREIKSDIKDVSDDVAALRREVANNELKQAVSSTKIGMIVAGIAVVASSIWTILLNKMAGKI